MKISDVHPIRAVLAVAIVGAAIYMQITGIGVAEAWWAIAGSVVTFYFMSD